MSGLTPDHLLSLRRSRDAWIGLTVLASLLVCGAIAAMYALQSKALTRTTDLARELRQAHEDLDRGFMHAALGGSPGSPWDRDAGLALMQQGIEEFRRALPRLTDPARSISMEKQLQQFAQLLAGGTKAESPAGVGLRVAFNQLHRLSEDADRDAQAELRRLRDSQRGTFWLVLAGSGLLRALVTAGAVRAAVRESDALASQHEADARFAELADNIRDVFWVRDPESDQVLFVNAARND